jgi:hypothetical protein
MNFLFRDRHRLRSFDRRTPCVFKASFYLRYGNKVKRTLDALELGTQEIYTKIFTRNYPRNYALLRVITRKFLE